MSARVLRALAALAGIAVATGTAAAQQAPTRPDSASAHAAYGSLDALLASLPEVAPPPFDMERALWLGSLPLACLDQMQPREAHRRGRMGGGRAASESAGSHSADTGAAQDSVAAATARDSAPGASGTGRARPGSDYLWLPTYRLVHDYDHTRAFWGCTDWHSAVSATWAAAWLIRRFPDSGLRDLVREKLDDHLGKSNLEGELGFFRDAAGEFERPYGYAWLLELQAGLVSWPDSQATRWAGAVAPLASWMSDSLVAYLAALEHPERNGTLQNTAFSLDLALDYADATDDDALRRTLVGAVRRFYMSDRDCDTQAEAEGARPREDSLGASAGSGPRPAKGAGPRRRPNTLSPCLAEAALMARSLSPEAFAKWLEDFLPPLTSDRFAPLREPVSDTVTGSERARLNGLSLQRAYAMERIGRALPHADPRVEPWKRLSAIQAARGFELLRGEVTGVAWVPAWALRYLDARSAPVPQDWKTVPTEPSAGTTSPKTPPSPESERDSVAEFADLASFQASLPAVEPTRLGPTNALWLSAMPLSCEDHPHDHPTPPPYLWEVTYEPVPDFRTTRAFYGCSDWHSAVNSTWTLVKLLKLRPELRTAPVIRQKLNEHLGKSNVLGDLEFFKTAGTFELPYGYAWLLRLQGELRSWDDPDARRWSANLQPLASWMADRMVDYLNGLKEPIRVGVHPMTAMAMDNSLAYAEAYDPDLEQAIRDNAKRFFAADTLCDTGSEPGPSDFASPCLMEATVMGRLMERSAWLAWVDRFLPPIESKAFRPLTEPLGPDFVDNPKAIAARSHIIGLAFMRAKGMGELANLFPADDPRVPVLRRLAAIQVEKGFQVIGAVGYAGSHYYATFATLYLLTNER